jgi:hypothetical protein
LEAAFGREGVVSILERAHEALLQNLAQLYICPANEMRGSSGEGFSALAAMAPVGSIFQFSVYVAVPWQHRHSVEIVDQLLCEAYIHEIAEHSLDFSHRMATLMELCVLPKGNSLSSHHHSSNSSNSSNNSNNSNDSNDSHRDNKAGGAGGRTAGGSSNFERLPRRILTQIHAMDVKALHRVERDTDRVSWYCMTIIYFVHCYCCPFYFLSIFIVDHCLFLSI